MQVAFVGYTSPFTGDLGGRSGAHAKCAAAFPGSHFCTSWEMDQASAPAPASTAWIDMGRSDQDTSRFFRASYSTSDYATCAGWTTDSPTATAGGNLARGLVFTTLGGTSSSWVSAADGGCGTARPISCCMGGTAVHFRGYSAARTGDLGGRAGANAICNASFAGSHFCTSWEVDQAAVAAPIPSAGAWIDAGNSDARDRTFRANYSTSDYSTCAGWTTASPTATAGGNLARGLVLTSLGGTGSSWVSASDGGCGTARPVACCDGYPPR